jgi:putative alpha-1,2-mannosidase
MPTTPHAQLVDPLLGASRNGKCLPGPYRPFAICKPGPDTVYPHITNGYEPGRPLLRFSHTHVAGTGGGSRYGNVGLTPFTGEPSVIRMPPFLLQPLRQEFDAIPSDESAELGIYRVTWQPYGIACELAATERAAVHRWRYPDGADAWFLLDGGAVIQHGLGAPGHRRLVEEWDGEGGSIGGTLEVVGEREIVGRCDLRGGWGHDHPYSVHFYLRSTRPFSRVLLATHAGTAPGGIGGAVCGAGARAACCVGAGGELGLEVGISFVSIA